MPRDQNADLLLNLGARSSYSLRLAPSTTQMAVVYCETSNPTKQIIDEWIGDIDYLNEGKKGAPRKRGANATAADAAMLLRLPY